MTKKKKKQAKKQRRKTEVLRALAKSGWRGQVVGDVKQPKKTSHRLHIKEIKTDLIKTFLFAVFVVILLIILKQNNLQFDLSIYK